VILVDTSVWIDHFHHSDPVLVSLLHEDEIGSHPLVTEELAMGSLRSRDDVLKHLAHLRQFPVLSHDELLTLVAAHALWGQDLSPVDVHLVGSVLLVPGAQLQTWDKRLYRAAEELEVSYVEGTADLYADGPLLGIPALLRCHEN